MKTLLDLGFAIFSQTPDWNVDFYEHMRAHAKGFGHFPLRRRPLPNRAPTRNTLLLGGFS